MNNNQQDSIQANTISAEPRQTQIRATLSEQGAMLQELRQVVPLLSSETPRTDLHRLIVEENVLRRNSLASRKKLHTKLRNRYFRQETPSASMRFISTAKDTEDLSQFALLAYALFVWNDALTFTLGQNWLAPKLRGETFITDTSDIQRELEFFSQQYPEIGTWGRPTHKRIAQHYLGFLRDCGFATGSAHKTLRRPFISPEIILFGVQLILQGGDSPAEVPKHPLFMVMGLALDDVLDSLSELHALGQVRFAVQGGVVHLEVLTGDKPS